MTTLNPAEQERCVLCAALNEVDAWHAVTRALSPRDFVDVRHRHIMAAIVGVVPIGRRTDVVAVNVALRAAGHEGLVDYVGELIDATTTSDPLPNWIASVAEASIARRMAVAMNAASVAMTAGESREAVEVDLDRKLAAIRASAPDNRVFDDKGLMHDAALSYLTDPDRGGTPYGFAPLDGAVLPPQPSHLVLFGGASGSGKSTVARNVLRQWVERYKQPVGWLTCEMSGEEQMAHLACMDSGVTLEAYYRRQLSDSQVRDFKRALEFWRDCDLLRINELGSVTPVNALRIFRRWREQGVTHMALDHLHRLDYGATKSGDDLRVPVASFAKSLKNFAKDSEALVMALVQYTKIKPHMEPGDDNIREANQILEEADAVFHIYRPYVAGQRDVQGNFCPLVKADGTRYFEHDAPKDAILAHDPEGVYVKLGKQRRRLRDALIRIPFNHRVALMYDSQRADHLRIA